MRVETVCMEDEKERRFVIQQENNKDLSIYISNASIVVAKLDTVEGGSASDGESGGQGPPVRHLYL